MKREVKRAMGTPVPKGERIQQRKNKEKSKHAPRNGKETHLTKNIELKRLRRTNKQTM